jgi:hypothetical protein
MDAVSRGIQFSAPETTLTDHFSIDAPGTLSGPSRRSLPKELADSAARVFRLGGEWYFSTRDGDIGPFRTREQAKREAQARSSVLKPG